MLTAGRPAPEFSLVDQNDEKHDLAALRGHCVLVYFYPRADTPGCTQQACGLRDIAGQVGDTVILGISPDKPAALAKFRDKYALNPAADLFAVVALLTLGTVSLALAGIDTGTAFGGMGASREATIIALVEPTLLVAIFALSVPVGSTNLGAIVTATLNDPAQVFSPVSLLAAVALIVVIIAETGRLPVDNPSTHLELTMVHEAMILEYSGPDLAMVELASSMRLTVFLGLLANLFVPWGIATTGQPLLVAAAVLAFVAKVALLGAVLAVGEVFLAKLRLFRVPELLAGSFVLGLLAVGASFFLA